MDGPSGEHTEEAEHPAQEVGVGAGGTDDTLSPWTEDDAAFTADPEFFEGDDQQEGAGRAETVDEEGRRRVRLAAPEGTEELLEKEMPRRTGLPDWAERWRARSAAGTVLTAVAFGLQQVFEAERKEPAIVMETSGDPPTDLPVEAHLEQLGPRQSTVQVRPWLLGSSEAEPSAEAKPPGEQHAGP